MILVIYKINKFLNLHASTSERGAPLFIIPSNNSQLDLHTSIEKVETELQFETDIKDTIDPSDKS
ncbi:12415_t:CDS:2 [Dentiscutata erythropus]|uniref:12415_t:CDS:1 n=1 Tax=Dentiscutata erythropus TaxID=1348616 RepID=A0A9N9J1D1_9GLOM|nr:12415_t:CDS:2 [Dentiscutata erythropus]